MLILCVHHLLRDQIPRHFWYFWSLNYYPCHPLPSRMPTPAISAHQSAAHPQRPCPMAATPHINVQGLLFSYPPLLALPWSHLTHVHSVLLEPRLDKDRRKSFLVHLHITTSSKRGTCMKYQHVSCGVVTGAAGEVLPFLPASHLHTVQTTAARDVVLLFQNQPIPSRNTASMENTGQFYSS